MSILSVQICPSVGAEGVENIQVSDDVHIKIALVSDEHIAVTDLTITGITICKLSSTLDTGEVLDESYSLTERSFVFPRTSTCKYYQQVVGKQTIWNIKTRLSEFSEDVPSLVYRRDGRLGIIVFALKVEVKSPDVPEGCLTAHQTHYNVPRRLDSGVHKLDQVVKRQELFFRVWPNNTSRVKGSLKLTHFRRKLGLERSGVEIVHLTLTVPKYVTIGEDLDTYLSLKGDIGSKGSRIATRVYLDHVEYELYETTHIGGKKRSHHKHRVQRHHSLGYRTARITSEPCSLSRNHTTMKIGFKDHDSGDLFLPAESLQVETIPTFACPYMSREYSLNMIIYLVHEERMYQARFEDIEVIILPKDICSLQAISDNNIT